MSSNYLRLFKFLNKSKKETVVKILLGIILIALNFIQVIIISSIINKLTSNYNKNFKEIFDLLIIFLIKSFIISYQESYSKKMSAKIKACIRDELLEKILNLGIKYQLKNRSGKLQSIITDGVETFETFLVYYIPHSIVVLITISSAVLYLSKINIYISLVLIIVGILSILIPHFFMPYISNIMIKYWKTYAFLNSQYIDFIQGMTTLKIFNASKEIGIKLEKESKDFAKDSIKNTALSLADSSFIVLFSMLGYSICILIASKNFISLEITYSQLLIILFLISECIKPFYELNMYWHGSYLGFSVAEELFNILDCKNEVNENKGKIYKMSQKPSIKFENLFFKYEDNQDFVLKNINLEINSGECVAIIGKSGSGKSTILNLLMRFFDFEKGNITIDDINIRDFDIKFLRKQISIVFQDTYLFYASVKENLLMANTTASDQEILKAAKLANAHKFIMNLPQGYNSIISEGGKNLSVGQRQRISIARAILKNAPILILDEATSSIDYLNEKEIQYSLEELIKNKTTIIISHKPSITKNVDKIYTLKSGELS